MKDRNDFHSWAEGIYNSMNDAQRATPSPFIMMQVLHKKQETISAGVWESISYWVTKPLVAFSILFFVIALNAFLITGVNNTSYKRSESNNDLFTTSLTSVYDVDNITP